MKPLFTTTAVVLLHTVQYGVSLCTIKKLHPYWLPLSPLLPFAIVFNCALSGLRLFRLTYVCVCLWLPSAVVISVCLDVINTTASNDVHCVTPQTHGERARKSRKIGIWCLFQHFCGPVPYYLKSNVMSCWMWCFFYIWVNAFVFACVCVSVLRYFAYFMPIRAFSWVWKLGNGLAW